MSGPNGAFQRLCTDMQNMQITKESCALFGTTEGESVMAMVGFPA